MSEIKISQLPRRFALYFKIFSRFQSWMSTHSKDVFLNQCSSTQFRLATWNTDGLCERAPLKRSVVIARSLRRDGADVLFLQEVVPETLQVFDKILCRDQLYTRVNDTLRYPYFVIMYVKSKHKVEMTLCHKFRGSAQSGMGREWVEANVNIEGVLVKFITSHLESCKSGSKTRIEQFKVIAQKMLDCPHAAVCGGDFNMRNFEQATVFEEYRMRDVYEHYGKPKHAAKTWICPNVRFFVFRFVNVCSDSRGLFLFRLIRSYLKISNLVDGHNHRALKCKRTPLCLTELTPSNNVFYIDLGLIHFSCVFEINNQYIRWILLVDLIVSTLMTNLLVTTILNVTTLIVLNCLE